MIRMLLFLGLICSIGLLQAQTKKAIRENQVPRSIRDRFSKENPDASRVRWKTEEGNYRVEYIEGVNNSAHVIVYAGDGNVLRRENELDSLDYPVTISEYFNKNYPGEAYVIWSRLDNTGKSYYSYYRSEYIRFDKDGNCISPKKNKMNTPEGIRIIK